MRLSFICTLKKRAVLEYFFVLTVGLLVGDAVGAGVGSAEIVGETVG